MAKKETVRIRSQQAKDRFGDPMGADMPWREVGGATVVPRESHDYEQRGPVIISGFLVRLPVGTPIEDTDQLEIRGKLYEIDGAVGDFGKSGKIVYTMRAN